MSTESVQNVAVPWTRVWLLFTFVTNLAGFDTAITISNISLDNFGTKPEAGHALLLFYGVGAPGLSNTGGTGGPGLINTGNLAAGQVWANTLSSIAPGFQGYVIALCNFPARGLAVLQRVGGSDAAPYVAEVLRVVPAGLLPEQVVAK